LRLSPNYRALADFRYEIRCFLNFSERAAREARLEPHQHQALLAIKGLPPSRVATIGVLAERLQIQHHSAVELANRMESKGLVRRSRETSDRRQVRLLLTSRGEKLLKRLTLPHWSKLQSTGTRFLNTLAGIIASADKSNPMREGLAARRKLKHHKPGIPTKRKR
jgi:DNA-binding MarR family transcriptional regulator